MLPSRRRQFQMNGTTPRWRNRPTSGRPARVWLRRADLPADERSMRSRASKPPSAAAGHPPTIRRAYRRSSPASGARMRKARQATSSSAVRNATGTRQKAPEHCSGRGQLAASRRHEAGLIAVNHAASARPRRSAMPARRWTWSPASLPVLPVPEARDGAKARRSSPMRPVWAAIRHQPPHSATRSPGPRPDARPAAPPALAAARI